MPAWHLCLFHSVFSNLRLNNNDAPEKDKFWHAEPEGHSFLIPREFTGIEHRETHVVTCLDVRTGSLSSVTVPYETLLAPAAAAAGGGPMSSLRCLKTCRLRRTTRNKLTALIH